MKCKSCLKRVPEDSRFCNFCGKPITQVIMCHKCDIDLPKGSTFCNKCGLRVNTNVEVNIYDDLDDFEEYDEFGIGELFGEKNEDTDGNVTESNTIDLYLPEMPDFEALDQAKDETRFGKPYLLEFTRNILDDPQCDWTYRSKPLDTDMCSITIKIPENYREIKSIEIPEGIVRLYDTNFIQWESLEYAKLPSTLEEIGDSTFSGCKNLVKVDIPKNLKNIGNYAFSNCSKLSQLDIPKQVNSLGYMVFTGCAKLEYLDLTGEYNGDFRVIGNKMFSGCDSLVVECIEGSNIAKAALESYVKVRYKGVALSNKPFIPRLLDKEEKNRKNGNLSCNGGNRTYSYNVYNGAYFDVYFDANGKGHLIRFDEDDIETMEILWEDNNNWVVDPGFYLFTNYRGVFILAMHRVLWFTHDGALNKVIDIFEVSPERKLKLTRWLNTREDFSSVFYGAWLYDEFLYYTSHLNSESGLLFKLNLVEGFEESIKIRKKKDCLHGVIVGDERYLHLGRRSLYDMWTGKEVKVSEDLFIDFENKCYFYKLGEKPKIVLVGFEGYELPYDKWKEKHKGSVFYEKCLFTGDAYYGFMWTPKPGDEEKISKDCDRYHVYKMKENEVSYMRIGVVGYSSMKKVGNYIYLGQSRGHRVSLDGTRSERNHVLHDLDHGAGSHRMTESEKIFRGKLLQVSGNGWTTS